MSKTAPLAVDEKGLREQFAALSDKVNAQPYSERDVERVRDMIRAHPDLKLWRRLPSPGQTAIDYLLQMQIAGGAIAECWRERVYEMKEGMGFDQAGTVERMLIQHVILCWLQLTFIELSYANILAGVNSPSLEFGRHWDRRVSLAQRRFTRATDALARLRLLTKAAELAEERRAEVRARRGAGAEPTLDDMRQAIRGEVKRRGLRPASAA